MGKVIRIDYNSKSATGGKFSLIAVENHLKNLFVHNIFWMVKCKKIEYENLPIICFNCGTYGRKNENCPKLNTMRKPVECSKNYGAGDSANGFGKKSLSSIEMLGEGSTKAAAN